MEDDGSNYYQSMAEDIARQRDEQARKTADLKREVVDLQNDLASVAKAVGCRCGGIACILSKLTDREEELSYLRMKAVLFDALNDKEDELFAVLTFYAEGGTDNGELARGMKSDLAVLLHSRLSQLIQPE